MELTMDSYLEMFDIVDNGQLQDFINFARGYNIFQTSNSKFYDMMCDKIKTRLDKENLPYDTVRPE